MTWRCLLLGHDDVCVEFKVFGRTYWTETPQEGLKQVTEDSDKHTGTSYYWRCRRCGRRAERGNCLP